MSRPPILDHPLWPELRKYIRADVGSQNQSRINVSPKIPASLRKEALQIRVLCHCGVPHQPIRGTRDSKRLQVYVTGRRTNGHENCSYGKIAREQALATFLDLEAFHNGHALLAKTVQ